MGSGPSLCAYESSKAEGDQEMRKKTRYYTENMNPKKLKEYYQTMLKFWTSAKDKSAITYYTNKLKELEQ
jgi:hypothetical protein